MPQNAEYEPLTPKTRKVMAKTRFQKSSKIIKVTNISPIPRVGFPPPPCYAPFCAAGENFGGFLALFGFPPLVSLL